MMPQSTGGAVAQRVLSAAAKAVASAVIVRVTQSTDTPAHKRAARNIMARAAAAGQVHVVAPARPKRGRSLAGELAAAGDAAVSDVGGMHVFVSGAPGVAPVEQGVPGEGRRPRARSVGVTHSEPAASNAEGVVSRDGAELGEGRGSAEISRGKRVRRSPRLSTL